MDGANRYSQFIGWVRVILPLLALALLSTLFLFARRPDPEAAIPFADADVEALARDQQIGEPRFAGTMADGTPITFNAERIAPVEGAANRFAAITLEGRLSPIEGAETVLRAATAILDTAAQTLVLRTDVRVTQGDDRIVTTQILRVDLDGNRLYAPQMVDVTGPGLHLTAGQMTAQQSGDGQVFAFTGGVDLLYTPQD